MLDDLNQEIFSFHLAKIDPLSLGRSLFLPRDSVDGLKHAESLVTMKLGSPLFRPSRYGLSEFVYFARWENQPALEKFLKTNLLGQALQKGWHVRLKFYRRWGFISELGELPENSLNPNPSAPVVGITLARLKISETLRFLRWGKPVESLVRDHPGKTLALAAMRPLNTLSTFSIWRSETEMIQMVQGKSSLASASLHADAMVEQGRRPFHHEFSTMRFYPLGEYGEWNGRGDYVPKGRTA